MRSRNLAMAVLVAMLGIGALVASVVAGISGPGPDAYEVTLAAGVNPRTPTDKVAENALRRLTMMETMADRRGLARGKAPDITSMVATTGDQLPSIVPDLEFEPGRVVWVVRAEGTFVPSRGRTQLPSASSGFFVIDDATGKVLALGMP